MGGNHPTNSLLILQSDGSYLCVDPAVSDKKEFERYADIVDNIRIEAIIISHAHLDHYRHVDWLAKHKACPILMSKETFELILNQEHRNYFDGLDIQIIENEALCGGLSKQSLKSLLFARPL